MSKSITITPNYPPEMPVQQWPVSLEQLEYLSRQLNSSLELDTVLDVLGEGIRVLMGATRGALFLGDVATGVVTCQRAWGVSASYTSKVEAQYRSLPGGLLLTERMTVVEDVAADPRFDAMRDEVRAEHIGSMLLVGLRHQNEVSGALAAYFDVPRRFSQTDIYLAQTLANHAVVAIKNAQLYQSAQQRMADLEALRGLASAVSSSLDFDQAALTILDHLQRALEFDSASIFTFARDSFRIAAFIHRDGREAPIFGEMARSKLPAADQVVETRRSLLIAETRGNPLWNPIPGHERIRCWMGVPMVFQGEIVGVLCVDSDHPRTFNDSHIALAQAFADQAATGLANARLYAAAQRRAEEVERVKNFNEKLLNSVEAGILLESGDDRVEYVNPRLCEMVGYTADELIGQLTDVLLSPEMGRHVDEQAVGRARGEKGRYEASLLCKDGSELPVLVNATPMYSGGVVHRYVDCFHRYHPAQAH